MRNFGAADRMTKIMERFGMDEGEELEHPWLNKSVETAQKRVEQRNYMIRKRTLDFDDVMNQQREVIYGYRNEALDTDDTAALVWEAVEEALPDKVAEHLEVAGDEQEPDYASLLTWVNMTFPLGLSKEKAEFEAKSVDEICDFLLEKVREAYDLKSKHEDPAALRGLERYIILNAIDRLWQEHLYGMDALREGVYLRAYGQKDPLVEYKNEAYAMFVELMGNIKSEVLSNLFRSSTSLQAFESFLASLPRSTSGQQLPGIPEAMAAQQQGVPTGKVSASSLLGESGPGDEDEQGIDLPVRRSTRKVGRNEPCPCGSGKKYKNCCGRVA